MANPSANLWYHDGSGYGWPALETGREEQIVDDPDHPGATLHLIRRNLIVFCGGEPNADGLEPGVNVRQDVPEGPPTAKGTCSHIAWQPGTPEHAAMVTAGLAEGAVAIEDERERLRLELVTNEIAAQALEELKRRVAVEHGDLAAEMLSSSQDALTEEKIVLEERARELDYPEGKPDA